MPLENRNLHQNDVVFFCVEKMQNKEKCGEWNGIWEHQKISKKEMKRGDRNSFCLCVDKISKSKQKRKEQYEFG